MELKNKDMAEESYISFFRPGEIVNNEKKDRAFKYKYPGIVKRRNSDFKEKSNFGFEAKSRIFGGIAAIMIVIVVCFAINAFNFSLGYEVIVDGQNIGVVKNKADVYAAIDETKAELKSFLGDSMEYTKEPVLVRRLVSDKKVIGKDDIKSILISNIDTVVECYAVRVNDETLFGVATEEAANWVLEQYKQKNAKIEMTDDTVVDFCEKTEIEKTYLHVGMLETPEDALAKLSGGTEKTATYVVQENDTLWGIAQKYETTVEHLFALNENLTENIKVGDVIKVEESVPLLSVKSVQTVSFVESVPYEVEKIKDDSMYENTTVVSQHGKEGEAKVIARVTKINGVETQKDVLETETVVQPVKQIEKIGTKERPATTGSGSFDRPTHGSLSSRYGTRWGRNHNGIDVAGAYNSDIKAADGGVVTYSGWMSGYGNYVVINHENGYQTAYGHCASLCVNVGDRVAKGDVIAKMGSTGRSTGTHLHFEIKKNGQFVNPLSFVSY